MTKDLALSIHGKEYACCSAATWSTNINPFQFFPFLFSLKREHYLNTTEFLDAINKNLQAKRASA